MHSSAFFEAESLDTPSLRLEKGDDLIEEAPKAARAYTFGRTLICSRIFIT
jgi:hypothetical protein